MSKTTLGITIAVFMAVGLAACDVEKTDEGNASLPKYKVEKTQEGKLDMPNYKVTPPEVNVKKEEKTVEVPTVETREKKVEVPDVDINVPKDK